MGGILLLLLVGLAAYAIWRGEKEKSYKDDSEYVPIPPTPKPVPARENPLTYVTMYKFDSAKNIKACRFCDGEIPTGANRCGICGEKIDA